MIHKRLPLLLLPLSFLVIGCGRTNPVDEMALRQWATLPVVEDREEPSVYTHSWIENGELRGNSIATGDFIEVDGGITIQTDTVLQTGFYVYPGKVFVESLEEAFDLLRENTPGKFRTEQGTGGNAS